MTHRAPLLVLDRVTRRRAGFTLLELVCVVGIIGVLAAIITPRLAERRLANIQTQAMTDIRIIAAELQGYDPLPATLADIGRDQDLDPWGNPYQYIPIYGNRDPGVQFRKDGFLQPLNADFDLWSMGPDGEWRFPLNAAKSRDDIVRANSGGFVGLATDY